jgi:hypothetical protein
MKSKTELIAVILSGALIALISSCSIMNYQQFPYGKWESMELGLALNITPEERTKRGVSRFNGKFTFNGNVTDVYFWVFETTGTIQVQKDSEMFVRGGVLPPEFDSTILIGTYSHWHWESRLRLRLSPEFQESFGTSRTIFFERIEEYGVAE